MYRGYKVLPLLGSIAEGLDSIKGQHKMEMRNGKASLADIFFQKLFGKRRARRFCAIAHFFALPSILHHIRTKPANPADPTPNLQILHQTCTSCTKPADPAQELSQTSRIQDPGAQPDLRSAARHPGSCSRSGSRSGSSSRSRS